MMQFSDNGWPGIPNRADLQNVNIRGTDLHFRVAPAAAWVLGEFASRFHQDVESLSGGQLDDWSYAWRPVRGSTTHLSCHASGTAIDLNALMHPRGVHGTYGVAKMGRLRKLLNDFRDPDTGISVIKWGGDWASPSAIVDEMHFQVRGPKAALVRVRAHLTPPEAVPVAKPVAVVEDELPTPRDLWTDIKFKEYADQDRDGVKDDVTPAQMLWRVDSAVQRIEAAIDKLVLALGNKV